MRKNIILFAVLLAVGCASFYAYYGIQLTQTDFASQQDSTVSESASAQVVNLSAKISSPNPYRGPLDDCLQNAVIYSRLGDMQSDCTLNYVHFYPTAAAKTQNMQKRNSKQLKIGSFNLFHLGDNQAPLKNLPSIASIMNRWDIVGGQEFMPLASDLATNNFSLYNAIQDPKNKIQFPFENWRAVTPGYLRLLMELQKLDSSWALILQSTPAGEGTTGEMAGFYYRSSLVDLKEWDYCPVERSADIKSKAPLKNLACLVQVPSEVQKQISRTAFAAYFQSGRFDFVGLTSHIRFRAPDSADDLKIQLAAICENHVDPKKCKLPQDAIGRFYEVMAVADQISEIKEKAHDDDIIFMGDFNLELQPKTVDYWNAALKKAKGFVTLQSDLTTLSVQGNKLASNYDHFILNPTVTKECDIKTAHAYNILLAGQVTKDPVLKAIGILYRLPAQANWVRQLTSELETVLKYQDKNATPVRGLSEKEKKDYVSNMAESLKRMQANDYAAEAELISDHIPIELSCRTDLVERK